MKKNLRRGALVLTLLLCLIMLTACHQLAPGFDEEAMYEKGCQVVELCNARDYEAVLAMFDQELLGDVTAAELAEQLDPVLDEYGKFEDFKTHAVAGSQDKNSGMELGILALRCAYENKKVIYTITFTENNELVGLFVQ
ncbi:MAG: DUF3887 domain-containing protein [Firmicutes bacterium]|nr:DUF3887 domain-containing protein [Bacillota bacterium]MBQ6536961.1 DUF3887 domain-containing protein [Bacillota bacterium]MBQ6606639.1 DUF3887 domain-containing protein [Bacillota bacterium]MBR0178911.1 DUF3887 domain-containing protein [Bacillota bacterium]